MRFALIFLLLLPLLLLLGCSRIDPPTKTDPSQPTEPFGPTQPDFPNLSDVTFADRGLPILSISIENGEGIDDTVTWKHCLVDVRGDTDFGGSRLTGQVRGRGNGSFLQSDRKKPLKIKFDRKVNLLNVGGGAAKDWVLLAQAIEPTFLRNFMALRMGQLLDGIDYSSGFRLVEVYQNGEYMGVYQLCEQVEVQKSRIRVTTDTNKTEIGFLVELDWYARGFGSFAIEGGNYQIKSDFRTGEQYRFITETVQRADTALRIGNREEIERLIDLSSLVDTYLLHEYLKNTDSGFSSFFFYRDVGGKITFTAPWDFDYSQGNDPRFRGGAWDGFDAGEGYDAGYDQDNEWFKAIWKQDWFRQKAAARWYEISDAVIPKLWSEAEAIAAEGRAAIEANYEKWQISGSYDGYFSDLMDWHRHRKAWLDENFARYLPDGYEIGEKIGRISG